VQGRIVEAERAGRVKGLSRLALELTQAQYIGRSTSKDSDRNFQQAGESSKALTPQDRRRCRDRAAIGAIAGGGKGAAIGAGAGGRSRTGGVMATRGKEAQLAIETRLSFRLRDAVNLTERLK